jgi:hypothetical protein
MRPTGKWSPRQKGAGRLSPRAIAVAEKRAEAIRLRIEGETFRRIAETLGVTTGRAHQLVDEAMRETVQEPAEHLRQIELARLDMMMPAVMEKARRGRLRSIYTMLRIMERRARLLGLDASPNHDTEMSGCP